MSERLQIAVLAAGQSTRFGTNKLDAIVAGKPLGSFALDNALAVGASNLVIVVAEPVPEFASSASDTGRAKLIINPNAHEGLSTSVSLAAQDAIATDADALLLLLADMPLVTTETLRQLAVSVAPERPAAVRHIDGNAGIPACFPRDQFAALTALRGDRGAGILLHQAQNLTLIAAGARELRDIDTPNDLEIVGTLLRS